MSTTPLVGTSVIAQTSSAWTSKINLVQGLSVASMVLAMITNGKISLSGDDQTTLVAGLAIIFNIITVVLRNYFSASVITTSATQLPLSHPATVTVDPAVPPHG